MKKLVNANDVISVNKDSKFVIDQTTFTGQEFIDALKQTTRAPGSGREHWFEEGVDCKFLSPGSGWKTGRFRIWMEFTPDEPDEPNQTIDEGTEQPQCDDLDAIRQCL